MKTHIVMNFGWALYSKQYVAVFTNPQMVAPCIFGGFGSALSFNIGHPQMSTCLFTTNPSNCISSTKSRQCPVWVKHLLQYIPTVCLQ